MSCRQWRESLRRVSVDEIGRDERRRYLAHLRDCRDCRQEAASRDPTIVFSLLPTEEVSDEEIDQVRQTVQALRRVRNLESFERGRAPRGLVAGAIAAMLLIAVVVVPQRRSQDGSERIPFAGAVGVGTGLVQIPETHSLTASGILQIELRRGAEIEPVPTLSVPDRLWRIEIPVEGEGYIQRDLEGGFRLHFDLGVGEGSDNLELRDFELLRTGRLGEESLLATDLQPEPNRPVIVRLPSEGVGPESLWLKLTWSKGTVAWR